MSVNQHLTSDEINRLRDYYESHVEDYVDSTFQLRTICSEMGQFPPEEELSKVLRMCGGRLNFNVFCRYALYLKYMFSQQGAMEEDDDTSRAFAALGGALSGTIQGAHLLETCQKFDLRTDVLGTLVATLDADNSGSISYDEFKELWHSMTSGPGEGADAGELLVMQSPMLAPISPPVATSMMPADKVLHSFIFPAQAEVGLVPQPPSQKKTSLLPNIRKKTVYSMSSANLTRGKQAPPAQPATDDTPIPPSTKHSTQVKSINMSERATATMAERDSSASPPPTSRTGGASPRLPHANTISHTSNNINDLLTILESHYQPVNLPPIKPTKPKKKNLLQARAMEKKLEVMKNSRERYKHLLRNIKGFVVREEVE
eukprot:PhF_6_TR21671/c0_g1_i2/m.30928